MVWRARAVILPVVLFVLLLLGLLGAMFSFRIHADVSATQVIGDRLQTRLAAEAGVEAVKLMLRTSRFDSTQWYHNPDAFHRILVWAYGAEPSTSGTNEEFKDTKAFRFSIVADDPTDDEKYIRFGITDEASKLNLNTATEEQLLALVEAVVGQGEENELDPQALVDAIVDWRDADSTPNGEAGDTEEGYYLSLDKPYRVKNGPFSSVEELLMVKGITGNILFGEDIDRNGLLTPNEDDGDLTFPPDNEDGILNRGLFPYLTVMSYESNTSNDNRPRIYLFGAEATLKKELEQVFPDEPQIVNFIVAATRKGPGAPGPGMKPPKSGDKPPGPGAGRRTKPPSPQTPPEAPAGPKTPLPVGKLAPGMKQQGASGVPSAENPRGRKGDQPKPPGSGGDSPDVPSAPLESDEEEPAADVGEAQEEIPGKDAGNNDGEGASAAIRSPASLLLPRKLDAGGEEPSPLTVEQLPLLMDRLSTLPPTERRIIGLINVNTAPRQVLECLKELNDEQIQSILSLRESLDAQTLATPAWLVTQGGVDIETFDKIASDLTARSQQFSIESLGYGDHIGMVTRLQVVVDMVGPIAQTIYYRDLSYLGGSYPIREEDKEQVRGR